MPVCSSQWILNYIRHSIYSIHKYLFAKLNYTFIYFRHKNIYSSGSKYNFLEELSIQPASILTSICDFSYQIHTYLNQNRSQTQVLQKLLPGNLTSPAKRVTLEPVTATMFLSSLSTLLCDLSRVGIGSGDHAFARQMCRRDSFKRRTYWQS